MNAELKEKIVNNLVKKNIADSWHETKTETLDARTLSLNKDDIGVTSDGITYVKSTVLNYLTEKGYQVNQTNIELAAKMLDANDGQIATTNVELHHELENISDEDLSDFLVYKLVEGIYDLKELMHRETKKEYAIEIVYDNVKGGTNVNEMMHVINKYSNAGWKITNIFTNEVGVNSSSISTPIGTYGTNATIDQTIIVFERSV